MIDFTLTEEQISIRNLIQDFVKKEVTPVVAERDRIEDPAQCFPWDIMEKAEAIGLRTLALSSEYGGGGQDSVTLAMCLEELAIGDYGFAFIFNQQWKSTQMVQSGATEKLRRKFLVPFRDDPKFLLALCLTEPDLASDHVIPFRDPKVGFKTTAVREGDYVVLNGVKDFISEGDVAKLYVTVARTDKKRPIDEGSSVFLVPRDTPGLSVGRVLDKMGCRLSTNAEVIYENCRVPMENMMGEWNNGLPFFWAHLRLNSVYKGACALGVARAAFEKSVDYAKKRVQGGKPIIEHPNIAIQLADMWTQIEAARLLVWKAAWACDHPEASDPKWGRFTHPFVSDIAVKVVLHALEIHGGYGPLRDVGVEKLVRDALITFHAGGTRDASRIGGAATL